MYVCLYARTLSHPALGMTRGRTAKRERYYRAQTIKKKTSFLNFYTLGWLAFVAVLRLFYLMDCQRFRQDSGFIGLWKGRVLNLSTCCNWTWCQGWELIRHGQRVLFSATHLAGGRQLVSCLHLILAAIKHHLSEIVFWVLGSGADWDKD